MGLAELTAEAEAVLHGRILSAAPHWNEDHTVILTTVAVEPYRYMKGDLGPGPITFDVPGGAIGDLRLLVSDMPEFTEGEEVVLFLRPEDVRVVGLRQGALSVVGGVVRSEGVTVEAFGHRVSELAGELSLDAEGTAKEVIVPGVQMIVGPTGEAGAVPALAGERDGVNDSMASGRPGSHAVAPASRAGMFTSSIAPVVLMTEDFESTWPNGDWFLVDQAGTGHEWGREDYKAHGGSYSMWEASAGPNALDPEFDDYADNMRTWARYGPFDLSDASSAELTFYKSINTAGSDDYLFWGASGNDTSYAGYKAYNGLGWWTSESFDLSSQLGDSTVWVAFLFVSDSTGADPGAFVDDVQLVKTLGTPPEPPVIGGISPGTGPSGAGFEVTISGSGFGGAQSTSDVRFTKDPVRETYAFAEVVASWTDTSIVCEVPLLASSGPVNIVVGGDPGTGADFIVTYSASPNYWQGAEPMGEHVLINANTADADDELTAVIRALQEWNAEGEAAFSFTYGGLSTATTYGLNELNEVCWGFTGGAVAATYTWLLGNYMMESDLVFDDLYSWSTDAATPPGSMDVRAIATHEFGHWLRMTDLYGAADDGKTMYGRVSTGENWHRTIEATDVDGIQFMYGPGTVNITSRELPDAQVGQPYSETLAASGGQAPYAWNLHLLSPPPGLALGADGVISGTPDSTGTFCFNVRVTDDNSDVDGQVLYITVTEATVDVPDPGTGGPSAVALRQNVPNPFAPSTNISFYLPEAGAVRLEIFDAAGRLVHTPIDGRFLPAGLHTIEWGGANRGGSRLSSGVYMYRLSAGEAILTRKMVLAR
jgi:hypothetical protein